MSRLEALEASRNTICIHLPIALNTLHDANRFHHQLHSSGRVLHRLDEGDVCRLEGVEGGQSRLQCGYCFSQVGLAVVLDGLGGGCRFVGEGLVCAYDLVERKPLCIPALSSKHHRSNENHQKIYIFKVFKMGLHFGFMIVRSKSDSPPQIRVRIDVHNPTLWTEWCGRNSG